MITAFSPRRNPRDWKTLYRAAILEIDRTAIPRRIAEAEQAVLARGRELFYSSGTREEQELLEDALYALRAFKTAWAHTGDDASSAAAA